MRTLRAAVCPLAPTLWAPTLWALTLLASFLGAPLARGQVVTLAGLRNTANHGGFKAARYLPDGTLVLLYDAGDGLRLLKTDAAGKAVLAQVQEGAAGDAGVALALDPAGNIYVAGTSTSGTLTGSSGVVYPAVADASTNSFLAKFDPDLHPLFLSFLGAGRTAVAGVAATADAAFVTGTTYNAAFPMTPGTAGSPAATGSTASGFVQRFSTDATQLTYSTLLPGTGDTNPAAIVADAADAATIAGETSAPDFPAVAALQPTPGGTSAGFLTKLTPAGTAFAFSTFVAGSGLTGLALDPESGDLLATGTVSLGQFPVATVADPLANVPYQSLLRLGADGQTLLGSVLLAPGVTSTVSAGPHGTAWVSGSLSALLFGYGTPGDSFLLHLGADGTLDTQGRFGGLPLTDAATATLKGIVGIPAVRADGLTATLPLTLAASAPADLAAGLVWDVPITPGPTDLLPALPSDLLPASCPGLSVCYGSAGLLAAVATQASGTSLSLSVGDLPNLTLRNTGPVAAAGLSLTLTGYTLATTCTDTLLPAAECGIVLTGGGPGSLSVTAMNAPALTMPLSATAATPNFLVLDTAELDFGVVTASSPGQRTFTVTNLGGTTQNFSSAPVGVPASAPYTLAETSNTCPGAAPTHTIAAGSSCTVTLELAASGNPASDGPVRAAWAIGSRDLLVTGVTQAADLSLSASAVDFGVTPAGSISRLPRYLYLSNNAAVPHEHTPVSLPTDSPFTLVDGCPSTLEPASVCQLTLTYGQTSAPSLNATTLTLDEGLTALVTGTVLAPAQVGNSSPDPRITLSPNVFQFADPVLVTELSTETGVISVTNTGPAALAFSAAVAGDFQLTKSCGTTLNPGATCDLTITFTPSGPGIREGLLEIFIGGAAPSAAVALSGTGTPLLLTENGTLALGSSPVGEPAIAWYKVQAAAPSLSAAVTGAAFGVALVEDHGSGHGTLPASAFASAIKAGCADCWLGISLIPQAAGPATGTLQISTTAGGQPYPLALTGTGLPLTGLILTPGTPDFGTVPLGSSSAPVTLTLTNLLTPASVATVSGVTVTGDFALVPDAFPAESCTGPLASTASCFLQLTFTPTAIGPRHGTLTLAAAGGSVTIPLSGSAVPNPGLGISPNALTFSNDAVAGPSSAAVEQTLTVTNTGDLPLTLTSVTVSDASFSAVTSCAVLQPKASCPVTVRFTPRNSEVTATLTLTALSGAGGETPPLQYTVPLTATYTGDETGLVLLPAKVDFGAGTPGTLGGTRQFTLWNTSDSAETVTLNLPQQFPLATPPPTCGTVAAGARCTFSLGFLPQAGGAITGSVVATAVSAGGTSLEAIAYLQGYGNAAGTLTISGPRLPGEPLNFGQVLSGETAARTLTLTNTGKGPLTPLRLLSAPPFGMTTTCGGTLAPGASCTATLTYAPGYNLPAGSSPIPRADDDVLLIGSDAASSPDTVELAGTALPVTADGSAAPPPSLASYTLSEGALTFPNTPAGTTSPAQTLTVANTGNILLNFGAANTSADFAATTNCGTLVPGDTCTVTVSFTPGPNSTATLHAGTLTLPSNAPDALEFVTLLGLSAAAALTISPSHLDFGPVPLGTSAQLPLTLTDTATLPISLGPIASAGDFTITPGTCPLAGSSIPAGESCSVIVTFAPAATGPRTGTVSLGTNADGTPLTVPVTGVGTAPRLQVIPTTLSFGAVQVGSGATLSLNLVNSGSAPLNGLAAAITGPDSGDFRVTAPCPATTYAPRGTCTLGLTFAPSGVGTRTATLALTSSDPLGPTLIPLTGTGTPASSFTLTVDGGPGATATLTPGSPVSFALQLTPVGAFAGPVALSCTGVAPAPSAACQLSASQVNLAGTPQSLSATLTTVGPVTSGAASPLGLLLVVSPAFLLRLRGHRRPSLRRLRHPGLICLSAALLGSTGCGGPGSTLGRHLTPPGTYTYQVTATAAGNQPLTSSVTLTLAVAY